jgi:hypothetical protein
VDRRERGVHATSTTSSATLRLGKLLLADLLGADWRGRAGRVLWLKPRGRQMMGRVMNDSALEQSDTEMLTCEVSDDALEAAAGGSEVPGRTFYGCLPPMPLTMAYGCPSAEWCAHDKRKLPLRQRQIPNQRTSV